jgi:hypothetical protein
MPGTSEIRFLPVGARRVAYETRGDGPPLVAPAWWVSHLELDRQSEHYRRFWEGVASGYALVRYDRLGVGMSDRTVRESDLTLADGPAARVHGRNRHGLHIQIRLTDLGRHRAHGCRGDEPRLQQQPGSSGNGDRRRADLLT